MESYIGGYMGVAKRNDETDISIVEIFNQIKSKSDKTKIINFALELKKKQKNRIKPRPLDIGYKGDASRKDLYDEKR